MITDADAAYMQLTARDMGIVKINPIADAAARADVQQLGHAHDGRADDGFCANTGAQKP